jgi:hypothetical protein
MSVRGVLREAWHFYVELFWRGLLVTAVVFLVLDLVGSAVQAPATSKPAVLLSGVFVGLLTGFGDLVVEGALAEDSREVHEGRPPLAHRELAGRTGSRLAIFLLASLIYAACVSFGLLLLVVPGLIVATRWSVIVPVIVFEDRGIRDGFMRSNRLVKGNGWRVFWVIALIVVVSGILETLVNNLLFWMPELYADWLGGYVVSLISAPYVAHALAVVYYQLVDLERSR